MDIDANMLESSQQSESDRNQITQRNAKSPLLRLPAELRNHIFALALTQSKLDMNCSDDYHKYIYDRFTLAQVRQPLNLLYVCRQTYAETALLPYKLNTFSVRCVLGYGHVKRFLQTRTEAQREAIGIVDNYT